MDILWAILTILFAALTVACVLDKNWDSQGGQGTRTFAICMCSGLTAIFLFLLIRYYIN